MKRVPTFTQQGFEIQPTPPKALKLLMDFYRANQKDHLIVEDWPEANTYVNHWEAPT